MMTTSKDTILKPLFLLVFTAFLGLAALSAFAIWNLRSNAVQSKVQMTASMVESAQSIVKTFALRAERGEIDVDTAKTLAKTAVRGMHYGDNEYFFIYDFQGNNIVHGFKAEREGKNFIDTKDAKGYAYLPDMIAMAKTGGGSIRYHFPKAGVTEPVAKISSVIGYEPWQWVIGTGVYMDDIDAAFQVDLLRFGSVVAAVVIIVVGMAWLLGRSIVLPLRSLTTTTSQISEGHYDIHVPAHDRRDEIGILAEAIDRLRQESKSAQDLRLAREDAKKQSEQERLDLLKSLADHLKDSVGKAVDAISQSVTINSNAANALNGVADQARDKAGTVSSAAETMNENIHAIASATEELSASIAEIASQVHYSSSVSNEAKAKAEESDRLVHDLTTSVEQITSVVSLIGDIASQTNLLALNATIEAARAGEAGKGFAVVAGEVKNLANQTARATQEIIDQIDAVRSATARAVDAIDAVGSIVDTMSSVAAGIASSVEEQSMATRDISLNTHKAADSTNLVVSFVEQLSEITNEVDAEAAAVSSSSSSLIAQVADLRSEIDDFVRNVRG